MDLAVRIATAQREYMAQAEPDSLKLHVNSVLEFGVTLGGSTAKTFEGKCRRLGDLDFWFRRLTQIADRTRESIAVRSLVVGSSEPYCSSESFERYLERQSARSANTLNRLQRELEKSANQPYLITKAASERAFESGYLSVFITLGLDGRFHSSSPDYEGRTFDDGYRVLHKIHDSLLDNLSQHGRRGEDFYGTRCVEVHRDGSPHFHTNLYIHPTLLPYLKKKLRELYYKQSAAMGHNFDKNVDQIIQVRQADDFKFYAEAVSYVFKNSYSGRKNNKQLFMDALRQKAVIGIYGKHQYELIGMNGSSSVIREIPKHKNMDEVADDLGLSIEMKDRRAKRLMIIKEIISGGAAKYRLIKEDRKNRYGEIVKRTVSVVYVGIGGLANFRSAVKFLAVICNCSRYKAYVGRVSWFCYFTAINCYARIRAPPYFMSCQTQVWKNNPYVFSF